ncbi:MAG: T9SS type A sorting domain-containing protein [Bacteroidetes bacterium]|nr:T9SS type A sorting domain-containing protein [Bacteroidota bacterium]
MKKLLLFLSVSFLSAATFAQTIPNGGFENWNTSSYEDPMYYWMTSNQNNILRGLPVNANKVPDPQAGTYAIQLTTVSNATDTSFGYFINGDPNTLAGGIPYSQHPVTLTGYYKSNIPAGDTGIILVIFKQAGSAVSFDAGQFYGVHNTYTPFTVTLNIPGFATPDSVIIGAASSNAFVFNGIPGSMLQIDNIYFTGVVSQPTQLNGSFENWISRSMYTPVSWAVGGDTIYRSTSAHSGTYCLQLNNISSGGPNTGFGVATTGQLTNMGPVGGRPYTLMQDTLVGWYKFLPAGIDSATVWINCTNNASGVGGAYVGLPPAAVWTSFSIPFSSFSAPDTLGLTFASVFGNADSTNTGSILYVDDVELKSSLLSTGTEWNKFGLVKLYPNPASNVAWIEFENNNPSNEIILSITDASGRKVHEENISSTGQQRIAIDLQNFASGVYSVSLEQNGQRTVRRLIVQ